MVIKRVIFLVCFVSYFFYPASGFAYNLTSDVQKFSAKADIFLNLVFCPVNYKDTFDFIKDRETLIRRLQITRPFDEDNNFKFWYVKLSHNKEEIKLFKPTSVFPPLEVSKDFLSGISRRIKGAYKLIIIDADSSISCAELSAPGRNSLIIIGRKSYKDADGFSKGFLHEFGHSLGLRDECVNCEKLCSSGPPNCAATRKEAENWWGDFTNERVGYIQGCAGNMEYFRPTIASLMNDPEKAGDFGPVNERYLRKVMKCK
jgi:hypothetical protein